jgi:hypothetical protein
MILRLKIVLMAKWLCCFYAICLMASCALFKPAVSKPAANNNTPFFDNITVSLTPSASPKATSDKGVLLIEDLSKDIYLSGLQVIEHIPPVIFKYAVLMDVEVERINNRKLIEYINQWWGVPYRIGGAAMSGIDCSAFMQVLASEAYGLKLPRTSREQANHCMEISKSELREGDFVFFNSGRGISHVGLYLSNNKFVHASTSAGVVISDLNELYWNRRFTKAGRVSN